ncbi:MAG: cysteine desulfurase [Planctomycetaceae bacterium]|nr:cysteine desulfurase [Planctomycetaceae bacterium]
MSGADLIYLDNNATTRIDPAVLEVMQEVYELAFANPGSRHTPGRKARQILEDSREQIATLVGAHPSELIFTSGGTESINLAMQGLAWSTPGTILSLPGEHPATRASIEKMKEQGWKSAEYPIDPQGLIIPDRLSELEWNQARLATLLWVHNETGVIQNLESIEQLCEENRLPLHIDAVQAVGKIPVNFREMRVTALSFTAHKFHGPRGIGALLLKSGCQVKPLLVGGFQESERRAGTEPVSLIAGMAKALQLWEDQRAERTQHLLTLQTEFETGLIQELPNVLINSAGANRSPFTSNIAFPGLDGEALLISLDLAGIACSTGSACASGSAEPSPILVGMGLAPEVYHGSLRFSFSAQNRLDEIKTAVQRIAEIVKSHSDFE